MRVLVLAAFAVILTAICPGCSSEPGSGVSGVYTSTRCVTSICTARGGSVWAAARGGVLWRNPSGMWRKFTVLDGLPSNEALGVSLENGSVVVTFPESEAVWQDGKWEAHPAKNAPNPPGSVCSVTWQGKCCIATAEKFTIIDGASEHVIIMPPSAGSHISALLPRGDRLWAAMFGDGLWEFNGKEWSRVEIGLPDSARDITALAASGSSVWVGTRREWIWEYSAGKWTQHVQPDEPYAANCQVIAGYNDKVYISTLEDGLVIRSRDGWDCIKAPTISSNAPRQMVEFEGTLYVRHGNGKVDSLEACSWHKDVFKSLPRKQASCIAADGGRLYIGQWGGWSEFDGKACTHHLQLPDLQGVQVTAILAEDDRIWIGTQGRGIAEISRRTNKVAWHDERNGLPDDWVKCIVRAGDTLYAGTFVGGLAYLGKSGWISYPELKNQEITALLDDDRDGLIAASRNGVYVISRSSGPEPLFQDNHAATTEVQALCRTPDGLWIGTRTGLVKAE